MINLDQHVRRLEAARSERTQPAPPPPFGALLADLRQRAGMSGSALARAASIDASYLSRMERGDREPPRLEIIDALAAAMKLGGDDWDALRVVAGHAPRDVPLALTGNPALRAVARRLAALEGEARTGFEAAVQALCRGW